MTNACCTPTGWAVLNYSLWKALFSWFWFHRCFVSCFGCFVYLWLFCWVSGCLIVFLCGWVFSFFVCGLFFGFFFSVQSTLDWYYRSWVEEMSQALGGSCWEFCPVIHQKSLNQKTNLQRSCQCNHTSNQGHITTFTYSHINWGNLLKQMGSWYFPIPRCCEDNPRVWWNFQTATISHRCRTRFFHIGQV